ncbi:MAG: methyltransferase regulatory domain-containing protein [Pirellula sp.]|jgi:methyltransferase-like protein/trans-aconitate methyltransferase|nr:methyltransferase regulatory domain-containing protein [Pirellula sp.]
MTSIQGTTTIPPTVPKVETEQQAYDDVPYGSYPVAASHPDKLYTMAKLFGLNPVLPDNARILEIGCAGGGNILPLASLMPNSTCVGVELSQVQVDFGKEAIRFTGMKNCTIQQGSVTDITPEFGKFDYILCHGVYSWVPDFVREAILRVCSENLSENGVAYVSYNVLPGWYFRGMIRGMMLEHVRDIVDPVKKANQCRALLKFLVDSNANSNSPHAQYLRSEKAMLDKLPDSYIMHEHMENINVPFYFRDFIKAASQFHLQFLGEASLASTWAGNLPLVAQQGLEQIQDAVQRGHYMDCISGRSFRETYLVHAGAKINRTLRNDLLKTLRFMGKFEMLQDPNGTTPADPNTKRYLGGNGQVITTSDLRWHAMMEYLTRVFPCSKSISELRKHIEPILSEEDREKTSDDHLISTLMSGVLGGWLDFRFPKDRMQVEGIDRPRVTSWAICQAQANRFVTNLRHDFTTVNEAVRQIIPLLDGKHDLKAIASEVDVLIKTGLLKVQSSGTINVDSKEIPMMVAKQSIEQLAKQALLLAVD